MNPLEKEYDLTGKLVRTKKGELALRIFHAVMLETSLRRLEDVELEIKIKPLRHKRSDSQNRYFWAVIIPYIKQWLFDTQGEKHSNDEVYAWIRFKLLGVKPRVVTVMNQEMIVFEDKKFSTMTTAEFAETTDKIRAEMLVRGLDIPEPTQNNHLHEHFKK